MEAIFLGAVELQLELGVLAQQPLDLGFWHDRRGRAMDRRLMPNGHVWVHVTRGAEDNAAITTRGPWVAADDTGIITDR